MYFVCKNYISSVKNMRIEARTTNTGTIKYMKNWLEKSRILNELAKVEPLREAVRNLYDTIPVMHQDQDTFDMSANTVEKFIGARRELIASMDTLIRLYDTINMRKTDELNGGFDVKLPRFQDIGDFSKCLGDLDFVIKQCPYLNIKDGEIRYGSVDVGSTWITFFLVGTAASVLLVNLSKIVDAAIKIKSHATTVKLQEEALRLSLIHI